jgi:exopolysaccharide biosynthesis polyprenyl glycosylphosphotransferase
VHVAAGGGPTVLGTYDDLPAVLHEHAVDQIAVTAPLDDPGLRPVIDLAIAEGKTVWLVLDAFGSRLMGQGGAGHVVVLTPERNSYGLLFKRLFDIAVAAVCLAITSPVFAACAIAIKLDDPSAPAIFRQSRVGLHGRTFTCLKFRSMVPDAERRRQDLLARNEMDGPVFKIKDDPRITPVGRVLRKHSFDELPQLWNVLRGDMSLVGPRPPLPDEVREYQPEFRRRLTFRPGLTCLWQVSGRNRLDFGQWMRLDLEYVDNWSFWLDLAILLRTIPVVLFGSGM